MHLSPLLVSRAKHVQEKTFQGLPVLLYMKGHHDLIYLSVHLRRHRQESVQRNIEQGKQLGKHIDQPLGFGERELGEGGESGGVLRRV